MKKNICRVLILLITIGSCLGCNLFWYRYVNKELMFSIELPLAWYKEKGMLGSVIAARESPQGKNDTFQENINVMVSPVPEKMDLLTFFEINKDDAFKAIIGEEFDIQEGEMLTASRDLGRWIQFSFEADTVTLRAFSAIWVKEHRAYVVTATSEATQFDRYKPLFLRAVRSLEIF
ncbi:hypothetical protein ACFL38_02040 [Candidatus Omnitrophota bacterium]